MFLSLIQLTVNGNTPSFSDIHGPAGFSDEKNSPVEVIDPSEKARSLFRIVQTEARSIIEQRMISRQGWG